MGKSTPAAGAPSAARRGASSGYAVLSAVDDDAYPFERVDGEPYGGTSPEERASTCSFLFFLWLTPVLKRGVAKKRLDEADMYPLCSREKSANVAARFQRAWDATAGMTSGGGNRMVAACWQLFRGSFFTALALKVASDLMRFVGPVALQQLLAWLGDIDAPAPWWCPAAVATEHRGYYYSGVMVVAMFFQSLLNVHSFVVAFRMGVVARSTIIVAVYDKALRQAVHARGGTPTGKIVNLMSSDAGRMQWALPFMHWMPAGLLQIAIAVSMLWQLLGSSLLVGIITCAVLSPVTATVTTRFHKFNSVVLAKRDIRVGKVNELLAAMKLCKSCAWERGFADRVDDERELELGSLFKYQVAVMLSGVMWECVPVIIAVVSFAAFAALGGELTAEVAFTALSLFDILVEPCTSFGWVVADVIMANTGFQRVGRYLDSPDLQSQSVHRLPAARSGVAVRVSGSCFTWGKSEVTMQLDDDDKNCALHKDWSELSKKQKKAAKNLACDAAAWSILREAKGYGQPAAKPFRLENVDFEIPVGSAWAVVGSVGAGKSSLLHALLGEMEREMAPASVVELHGSTAFAPQSAFIVNATIKENILFGCEYDAKRYDSTIEACCLRPDLALFAAGDQTEVGEQVRTNEQYAGILLPLLTCICCRITGNHTVRRTTPAVVSCAGSLL
jgi:ABC-type multidrug transport system fused ATPase/permease subunit